MSLRQVVVSLRYFHPTNVAAKYANLKKHVIPNAFHKRDRERRIDVNYLLLITFMHPSHICAICGDVSAMSVKMTMGTIYSVLCV